MEKVTPEMEKAILNATEAVDKYRLVAEVVSPSIVMPGYKLGRSMCWIEL